MTATSAEDHAAHIERMLRPALARAVAESVPLASALGRVTIDDVRSAVDLPLFRNSQMDGFAVRADDLAAVPATLRVVGEAPAGHPATGTLQPGTALRIMTGAPVPAEADAVVPVEDTDRRFGADGSTAEGTVTISRSPTAGDFVRDRGSDLRRGDLIVPAGVVLAPRHLAALAAAGHRDVPVRRRLRVAVITTGAELVETEPGTAPGAGQIYDSNSIALATAVAEAGATVSVVARSDDRAEMFRRVLDEAVAVSDLVITSGGISHGAYEVVRDVLEPLGASVCHVAMQPGGPQATAVVDGVPVVCFPGNPVSTQVSFVVFLRNPVRTAAGLTPIPARTRALAHPLASVGGKRQFLRGTRLAGGAVEQVAGAGSHLVAAMARSDVLIDIPAETTYLAAGADVAVWAL
ncbi:molybdopterin molybdotransferase MoeA [Glaciibacter sp. 2TAF33]|uniref:molybdopterin molybdotransferase MoeA n=1 Tax=Glaciibacter sp. 2TAF33 TaxID=3233015 RepID=UPI003F8EADB2